MTFPRNQKIYKVVPQRLHFQKPFLAEVIFNEEGLRPTELTIRNYIYFKGIMTEVWIGKL